jgi:hypothetical protein
MALRKGTLHIPLTAAQVSTPRAVSYGDHILMTEKVLRTNHQAGLLKPMNVQILRKQTSHRQNLQD